MSSKILMTLTAVIFLIPFQLSYADYDSFTVNVPNSQGGYTALVIRKSGDGGYIGPQGEHYSQFPSVVQLQAVYGLNAPQVERVVTYQVVNPAPYEPREMEPEDYQEPRPNVIDGPRPESPMEDDSKLMFFDLKKKKKSKPSAKTEVQQQVPQKQTQQPGGPPKDQKKNKPTIQN